MFALFNLSSHCSLGTERSEAEICSRLGEFRMDKMKENYQEPSRCQFGGVEYCHGEILRGMRGWSSLQICSDGRIKLMTLHHNSYHSAMKMFLSP